jgi:hypothetical protein
MAGTLDAGNGDTAYVLTTPPTGAAGFVIECGNTADGEGVWIANVDPVPNQVRVTAHGAHGGTEAWNLSAKGDEVFIPAGDVTRIVVDASAYPTTIGWAYLHPRMVIHSGQRR